MLHFRALRVAALTRNSVVFKNVGDKCKTFNHHSYSLKPPLSGGPLRPSSQPPKRAPPRKFPELLYFPKFFRWLGMKLKMKYLRRSWDPEFSEGAFIYGTTRAICRISEIVHQNKPDELKNLLTPQAEEQLRSDMIGKLTPLQKKVILLTPNDIKLLVPIKVQLIKTNAKEKQCMIMLKSLSMKWHLENHIVKLVLIVIDSEFTREYTTGHKSEWIVSLFKIVQCALISGSSTPPKPA